MFQADPPAVYVAKVKNILVGLPPTDDEIARMSDLTFRILKEIAQTSRTLGARPVFAYLPVYGEIDKPDNSMTRREHAFFSFCREEGIQSIYLQKSNTFPKKTEKGPMPQLTR